MTVYYELPQPPAALTPAEAAAKARTVVSELWTMHAAATQKVSTTFFILGGGEQAQQTLRDAALQIGWLSGEGIAAIEAAARGVSSFADPVAQWEAWKTAAIAVGDSLTRLQGLSDRWGAGTVLADTALNVGLQAHAAAGQVGDAAKSSLPLALVAIIVVGFLLLLGPRAVAR